MHRYPLLSDELEPTPDMFVDYEDYEDSLECIAGAEPGQRYG